MTWCGVYEDHRLVGFNPLFVSIHPSAHFTEGILLREFLMFRQENLCFVDRCAELNRLLEACILFPWMKGKFAMF
jgi:hypothetical protein